MIMRLAKLVLLAWVTDPVIVHSVWTGSAACYTKKESAFHRLHWTVDREQAHFSRVSKMAW
jgi:hypothetical protein